MNFEDYLDTELTEALKTKYVVRDGKRKKKWVTTKKGKYKVVYDASGKPMEVRLTAAERRKRRMGQKRGKLKRKSKMGIIELRRKKSFIARRNNGMQYNKNVPDIVASRGPDGRIGGTPGPKRLHPANESFLFESPHSFLFSAGDVDYCWDFYAEAVNDGTWLEQVLDIYKNHKLITLVKDANNKDVGEIIEIPTDALYEITDNLFYNIEFINTAAKDWHLCPAELKVELENYLPMKLYKAIIMQAEKWANK